MLTPIPSPDDITDAERFRGIDSLLDALGEHVARLPIDALPTNRPGFGCSFRSIPPVPYTDMATVERLERIAADAREEMGEERWQRLNQEWNGK